ncbi:Cilia and flagella-associated protein 69 [Taenia solium]|eukprot:TsM_000639500 transcript=TsM_000639500 gene=TsM_000639500
MELESAVNDRLPALQMVPPLDSLKLKVSEDKTGRLLEVKNSDIHRSVLHAVKFHLTDSTHFIVSCIEASCFIEKLCKFLRFPVCMEAKAEALDVFRRLADKCTSTLVNSLECEGVATLCTEVPDKSVLMVNETLSVVLLHCLDGKLLVKAGEDVSRSLLDFLIFRIPQYLHTQHRLSPSRKILHQKAAIGNLLVLLSSVNEGNAGLVCGDIETLLHQLTTLVNRKDKSKEHLDLLCSYLSVLSMLDGAIVLVELEVVEMLVSILEQCIDSEDSSPERIIFEGSLCLSLLCDGSTERCLRVGSKGMHVLIVLLTRLQTQLYDEDCPELTDWLKVEQPIGKWPPVYQLVISSVEAIQSCTGNCTENRRLFIQHGGVTVLLNTLEVPERQELCQGTRKETPLMDIQKQWMPPELSQPIIRCVCNIYAQENSVKKELISWRGVRQRSAVPIDESLFDKHETKTLTLEEELVMRMNEYRIDQKHAPSTQEWGPLMKFEDLHLLIYLLLRILDFGQDFHLNVDDQITMVDIENFPNAKEDDVVQKIQADLRRCGVNPIAEDQEKLEKAMQISQTRTKQVMRKKLELIKEAIECDACQEAEVYAVPREIMQQRKAALQRESEAQMRTSNYAYLCAFRREKQRAIDESRRRCQDGSCVTSTAIGSAFAGSSLQCDNNCSHSQTQ